MVEVIAFRVGTARLKKLGIHHGMLVRHRSFQSTPPPLPCRSLSRLYAPLILRPLVLE